MHGRRWRVAVIWIWMALGLWGAPPLTTIQDVLYKADGSLFNGLAFIEWQSFEAADTSAIATNSVVIAIVNGNLRVQLVPTTNASGGAYYSVTYNSAGRIQFTETWAVPSSTTPLRVRDVRTGGSSSSSGGTPTPVGTEVQISDVVGLAAELAARPLKSPDYAVSRAAVINSQGELTAAAGNTTDCVRVDGSSGSCGSTSPSFIDAESPAGAINGSNATFTLSAAPSPATSLQLSRNGLLQKQGTDYTLSSGTITFASGAIPQSGDTLLAIYRVGGAGSLAASLYGPSTPQVLCGSTGAGTSSTSLVTLGSCSLAAGTLQPGDRVELRFDYAHQGVTTGFAFEIHWGATTLIARAAAATETIVTGKSDAALYAGGAQWNAQSWGTALALGVGIGNAADLYNGNFTIDFLARMAGVTTDSVTLRNFTVIRYPAVTTP